jgi:CRP/FNR family transcriptional regulator
MFKIEEISMFSNLPSKIIAKIKDKMFVKEYTKNSIVFYEGDKGDSIYIILEGKVKLYKTTPKGNHIHINVLKAPELIGEYATFENVPFPATCEFVTNGAIGKIPYSFIKEELLAIPDVSEAIIKSLTAKVHLLSTLVHQETVLSSEAKVADVILNRSEIFTRLKNSEIADILNLTPETLSRILSKFKKDKVIELKKQELKILDPDRLRVILSTNKFKECTNCILQYKKELGLK